MPGKPRSATSASTSKVAKHAKKRDSRKPKPVVIPPESASSDEEEGEDDGVDEEGMAKLMQALGEDGLDELGEAQLEVLNGADDEEGDGEDDEKEDGAGDEDGDWESADSEDEEEVGNTMRSETVPQDDEDSDDGDEEEDSDAEGGDEEDVALEDAASVDDDAVPRQKLVVNNKVALDRILDSIKLDPKMPWTETLSVTYPDTIGADVEDDLKRELAFYKQALHGADAARKLAAQHGLPFTRPADYYAEMVKSDSHMERIRQRLLDETATIKKSEDKRREREGKKFGKQVQIEKQKERERSKREMEDRLKGLKRKRKDGQDVSLGNDDAFDVAVEDAIQDRPSKRSKPGSQSKMTRNKRDSKFGFGGKSRHSKQNTRESTEKFDYGQRKGPKGKPSNSGKSKRPGKSKRMASKNR